MPLVPEAGGTERVTSLVADGLAQSGHTCLGILVFNQNDGTISYGGEPVDDLYGFLRGRKVDVVVNQIAYASWLLEMFLENGGALWRSEGGKIISCLHFDPQNPSFAQFLMSCDCLTWSQRMTLVRHCVLQPYYKWRQQKSEGQALNYIYDNSDVMVALSAKHFKYMRKVMRRNEYGKLHAIGNPLTFSEIADGSSLNAKEKIVLVCARMSEYHKRITLVLKAWKLLKRHGAANEWRLEIVGDGPDLPRYKRIVERESIADVTFAGQQSPLCYYKRASILLVTSSAEGWGLTITEALQNGVVPVVMNSSVVYADIIDNGYNGYLTPNGDLNSLVRHVQSLITDSSQLRAMQRNALESAHRFTIDKTISRWEAIL